MLRLRRPAQHLQSGGRVELVPGYIDLTIDRYVVLRLVQGDVLVDIAPIEARGAS